MSLRGETRRLYACKCIIIDVLVQISHHVGVNKPAANPEAPRVLATAVLNAGKALGLKREEIGQIVGRDRSRIRDGIDPASPGGQAALLLVRCYRSLYALVDGDPAVMSHWMETPNHGTGGVPREQVFDLVGLVDVVQYLDAIRGKV